ncbi:MAG: hypothetical protein WCO44_15610 [Bacteroidota bacterium]
MERENNQRFWSTIKLEIWKAIIAALITGIIGGLFAYVFIPKPIDPVKRQVGNLCLEGKWKYICTSYDGTYQHGGRFIVQKEPSGSLILNGDRMWRDEYDSVTKKWRCVNYKESDYKSWKTNWISIQNNTQMMFEYELQLDKTIKGYCTGVIIENNHGEVKAVEGWFYILGQKNPLYGKILFKKVSDTIFSDSTTLTKNHTCEPAK